MPDIESKEHSVDSASPNQEISEDKTIPVRVLLALISFLSKDMVHEISPRTNALRVSAKVPMILLCWTCGVISATNLVLIKCFGEILRAEEFSEKPIVACTCFFFGVVGSIGLIMVLNVAMRYYDGIDVLPIFQSFMLLCCLVTGWVVLDEISEYTAM